MRLTTGEQLREMARLFGGSMPSRQTLLGALRRMGRYDSPATDTELEQLLSAGISADKERIKALKARNAELLLALNDAAQSLTTISKLAGKDEFMRDLTDTRSYAKSRAVEALRALTQQEATQ